VEPGEQGQEHPVDDLSAVHERGVERTAELLDLRLNESVHVSPSSSAGTIGTAYPCSVMQTLQSGAFETDGPAMETMPLVE
jgi:hypothetical protein